MTKTTILSGSLLIAAVVIGLILQTRESSVASPVSTVSWKSFDEGIALAQRENKKVLVDVYTDWCSWCKKMDSEVYTDPAVTRILGQSFVAVKLNAESSKPLTFQGQSLTEGSFSAGAGVTGYPTTIFLESNSTPITLLPGFVPAERFATILAFIGEDHYKTTTFEDFQKKRGIPQ